MLGGLGGFGGIVLGFLLGGQSFPFAGKCFHLLGGGATFIIDMFFYERSVATYGFGWCFGEEVATVDPILGGCGCGGCSGCPEF